MSDALILIENAPEVISTKMQTIEDLLSGKFPIPELAEEVYQLCGDIKNIGNIEQWLLGDLAFNILKNEKLKKGEVINGPFIQFIQKWKEKTKKLFQYPDAKQVGKDLFSLKSIEEFSKQLQSIPSLQPPAHFCYEAYQLNNLYAALKTIHDMTTELLSGVTDKNPSTLRKMCHNVEFHQAVLFYFTTIGQCIQNLKSKASFRRCASLYLRREFETLRWIRNSIMHGKEIDESGSILQFFGNDFFNVSLTTDAGRAFDSDEYLKILHNEIEKTIELIGIYEDKEAFFSDLFHHPQENLGNCFPSLEKNEQDFFHDLILQKLKKAVRHEDHHLSTLLLNALGEKFEGSSTAYAKILLAVQRDVTLEDLLYYKIPILKLGKKYNLTILGLFGRLTQNSFEYKDEPSGFLVECLNGYHASRLAYFKIELNALLGKQFLVVTPDDVKEYFLHHNQAQYANLFIKKAQCYSLEKVVCGYQLFLAVEKKDIVLFNKLLIQHECLIDINVRGYTSLHLAVLRLDEEEEDEVYLKMISQLLFANANPNLFDKHGKSTLHYAAEEGKANLLQLLLKYKADPNLKSSAGYLPIELMTEHNPNPKIFHILLSVTKMDGQEKLIQAIRLKDIPLIQEIFQEGVDVNKANQKNEYPFLVACSTGDFEVVKLICQQGVNILQKDKHDNTVLHLACYADHDPNLEIIEFLLKHKIDPNAQNSLKETALHQAIFCGKKAVKIIKLLKENDADPNISNSAQFTPLLLLLNGNISVKNIFLVNALIEIGSNLLLEDKYVGNALHMCAERNHLGATQLILEKGIDLNIRSSAWRFNNLTAYEIAQREGHYSLAKLIRKKMKAELGHLNKREMAESVFAKGFFVHRSGWFSGDSIKKVNVLSK